MAEQHVADIKMAGVDASAPESAARRRFLAAAGAGGLAAFLAACGSSKDKNSAASRTPLGGQDLVIVNYALTLEYVEADFYDKVVESGVFSGKDADAITAIRDNEHEHVAALEALAKQLGGTPAEKPVTQFSLGDARSVLKLAVNLENTGAAAYLGQVDSIENREVLAAALSIHSIEGRHAAKVSRMLGVPFAPDGAFAEPQSMSEVNAAVSAYIV